MSIIGVRTAGSQQLTPQTSWGPTLNRSNQHTALANEKIAFVGFNGATGSQGFARIGIAQITSGDGAVGEHNVFQQYQIPGNSTVQEHLFEVLPRLNLTEGAKYATVDAKGSVFGGKILVQANPNAGWNLDGGSKGATAPLDATYPSVSVSNDDISFFALTTRGAPLAPTISGITGFNAEGIATATVDAYDTVTNVKVNGVDVAFTEVDANNVSFSVPKGGMEPGQTYPVTITHGGGEFESYDFDVVFAAPVGWQAVQLASISSESTFNQIDGLAVGDYYLLPLVDAASGESIVAGDDGIITMPTALPGQYVIPIYFLDQSDNWAAGATENLTTQVGDPTVATGDLYPFAGTFQAQMMNEEVQASVARDITFSWQTINSVQRDVQFSWETLAENSVQRDFTFSWATGETQSVQRDVAFSWVTNALGSVQRDIQFSWETFGAIARDVFFSWRTSEIQSVQRDFTFGWTTFGVIARDMYFSWTTTRSVERFLTFSWTTTQSVKKDMWFSWKNIRSVILDYSFSYETKEPAFPDIDPRKITIEVL